MRPQFSILSREGVIANVECPQCGARKGQECDQPEVMAKKRKGSPVPNHKVRMQEARRMARGDR